jgi:hypothetical protein
MRDYFFYDGERRLSDFPYTVEGNIFVQEGDYFHSPDGWVMAQKVEEPSTGSGFYKVTCGPPIASVVFEAGRGKLFQVGGLDWHLRSKDGTGI